MFLKNVPVIVHCTGVQVEKCHTLSTTCVSGQTILSQVHYLRLTDLNAEPFNRVVIA